MSIKNTDQSENKMGLISLAVHSDDSQATTVVQLPGFFQADSMDSNPTGCMLFRWFCLEDLWTTYMCVLIIIINTHLFLFQVQFT